jgi:hypothetical protein
VIDAIQHVAGARSLWLGAPVLHVGANGHLGFGYTRRQKLSRQADWKYQRQAEHEEAFQNRRHSGTDMGRQ